MFFFFPLLGFQAHPCVCMWAWCCVFLCACNRVHELSPLKRNIWPISCVARPRRALQTFPLTLCTCAGVFSLRVCSSDAHLPHNNTLIELRRKCSERKELKRLQHFYRLESTFNTAQTKVQANRATYRGQYFCFSEAYLLGFIFFLFNAKWVTCSFIK